jgi:hypothetical protein
MPDTTMSACHEMAWAQAMGWDVKNGQVPLAAVAAQAQGLHGPSDHGWAFIDAVHWHISQGQVNLSVPTPITADETAALGDAMRPYLEQDGIHLHAHQPGRWLAHATVFKHLPSVSLDCVNGQRIDHWLQPHGIERKPMMNACCGGYKMKCKCRSTHPSHQRPPGCGFELHLV